MTFTKGMHRIYSKISASNKLDASKIFDEDNDNDDDDDDSSTDSDNEVNAAASLLKTRLVSKSNVPPRALVTLEDVAAYISNPHCKRIVVLTGAGISTAAGIPDFRSPHTGLYAHLRDYNLPYPEAVFDLDYFAQRPAPFFKLASHLLFDDTCAFLPAATLSRAHSTTPRALTNGNQEVHAAMCRTEYMPTIAHYFIKLLDMHAKLQRCYTQNVDGLELKAQISADKMVFAHGNFETGTCQDCNKSYTFKQMAHALKAGKICKCNVAGCTGVVKPDIVFFGESLPRAYTTHVKCDFASRQPVDLLLVIGTSLKVRPVCNLVDRVPYTCPRVLINAHAVGPFKNLCDANIRDVTTWSDTLILDDCQSACRKIIAALGWTDELTELLERNNDAEEPE